MSEYPHLTATLVAGARDVGMPEELLDTLNVMLGSLVEELGESSEAWRGAAVVAAGLAAVMISGEKEADVSETSVLLGATTIATAIWQHPLAQLAARGHDGPWRPS